MNGANFSSPLKYTVIASQCGAALNVDLSSGARIGGEIATDDTAVLNAVLAPATANAPVHLVLDGPASHRGIVMAAQGHTSIEGLGFDTGLYNANGGTIAAISNGKITPFDPGTGVKARGKNVSLRNFFINGNRSKNSKTGNPRGVVSGPHPFWICGIDLANIQYLDIQNIHLTNVPTYAIRLNNVADVSIRNVRISGAPAINCDGIHIDGPANNIHVSDCTIATPGDDALAMNCPEGNGGSIERVTIANCIFDGCLTAVRTYTNTDISLSNVVVTNCTGSVRSAGGISGAVFFLGEDSDFKKTSDAVASFTASNCLFSSNSFWLKVADPIGVCKLTECTWMAPTKANPWLNFRVATTISDITFSDCMIYRNTKGSARSWLTTVPRGATIKKLTINGFKISDQAGQSFKPIPYLIDVESGGAITELVINALDPGNISALVNPKTGFGGVSSISGPGVLASGFRIPDSVMANNVPYISATGPNAGAAVIKLMGNVKAL